MKQVRALSVTRFEIAPDDETTARCPTCGGGFPPGTGGWRHAYPDPDDDAMFHEDCEP